MHIAGNLAEHSGRTPRGPRGLRESGIPLVDAHHHLWDLTCNNYPWLSDDEPIQFRYGDYTPIRRNYLPADYRRDTLGFNVVATVHVEAEWERSDPTAETRWLETIHAQVGFPNAVIGHASLDRADILDVLSAHARSPLIRGVRHKPAASPTPIEARRGENGSMDDPVSGRGYALLKKYDFSYDLQTPWWHLDSAADLARDFPGTTIIVNHTGLPSDRSPEALAAWRRAMEGVAAQSNAALKISGLGRENRPWKGEENETVIRDAINIFGVTRCMFASNFPVDSLVGSFEVIFEGFWSAVEDRPLEEKRMLFHDNAARIYRLA